MSQTAREYMAASGSRYVPVSEADMRALFEGIPLDRVRVQVIQRYRCLKRGAEIGSKYSPAHSPFASHAKPSSSTELKQPATAMARPQRATARWARAPWATRWPRTCSRVTSRSTPPPVAGTAHRSTPAPDRTARPSISPACWHACKERDGNSRVKSKCSLLFALVRVVARLDGVLNRTKHCR